MNTRRRYLRPLIHLISIDNDLMAAESGLSQSPTNGLPYNSPGYRGVNPGNMSPSAKANLFGDWDEE